MGAGSCWHPVAGGTNGFAVVFIICVKRAALMSTAPEEVDDGVEEEDFSRSCSYLVSVAFGRETAFKSKERDAVRKYFWMPAIRGSSEKCRSYLTCGNVAHVLVKVPNAFSRLACPTFTRVSCLGRTLWRGNLVLVRSLLDSGCLRWFCELRYGFHDRSFAHRGLGVRLHLFLT